MTTQNGTLIPWRELLSAQLPPDAAEQIDRYETQLGLKRQGRLDDKVFAELRLRRGAYGQRYDNGRRHDGVAERRVAYPDSETTKGPDTLWHALGMQRIKVPFGALTAEQLEVLADLAEDVADSVLHVTTRQDVQLHNVHIDDTPDLMRRLAAVGVTTQEACGNVVRNVTGCPLAGVCRGEAFDVSPYARALATFLLGHPDAQDFGRKFKISFSGCRDEPCGLAGMHDIGLIARLEENPAGTPQRGFEVRVGGGLGAVPHQAELYAAFIPAEELLPLAQAICRVFARHGEKQNRSRARLKFLVARLGVDAFRELVEAERETLPDDPRWRELLSAAELDEGPASAAPAGRLVAPVSPSPVFAAWAATNVEPQRQPGRAVVTVALPLGDLSAAQARVLAAIARRCSGGELRTTVEQNIVLRNVPEDAVPGLFEELTAAGLAEPGAGTLVDVTACPGTDTCKLGIASSRGLAAELRRRVTERGVLRDQAVRDLRIKISGCFNSCGQHHVADVGFYGVSRKLGRHLVPHFQVLLGGRPRDNAGSFGLAVVAVPSKLVPEALERIVDLYLAERTTGESFAGCVERLGKARFRAVLEPLTALPQHEAAPALFSDWGDPRTFTLGDLGVGECAGQVVSAVALALARSERDVFEAQLALDEGRQGDAAARSFQAMLVAAQALVESRGVAVDGVDEVLAAFRRELVDSGLFLDRFAGAKFAGFFLAGPPAPSLSPAQARQRVEEAQLFLEAAHACQQRLEATGAAA